VNTGGYQKRGRYPTVNGLRPTALVRPIVLLSGSERRIEVKV